MKASLKLLAAVFIAGFAAQSATAQDAYPSRTIRIVVPYAPGGATDIVARIVADKMQQLGGQPVIVLNKPGAFGMIAIDEMVKSAPDGYTLMVGNVSTNAITPVLYADKMSFDYSQKVAAVTNLIGIPAFLLATTANDFPPKTVKELIDYAKKNPGKVRYGTVGVGSYPHYDMAYFDKKAGDLQMVALPNKNGATGVIQDLLRGDSQTAFLNVASTAGQIRAGKLRALALVNNTRLAEYPDVPTMTEAGFKDVGTIAWNGMFAPAATPKPVLDKVFALATKALADPDVQAKLTKQNFEITPNKSLDEARAWLTGEIAHWKTITSEVKLETH
ncbi:MAG TPA: tripartite tricarboxylate transporter substrate binding protein [Pseudolabrys sp.]